MIIIEYGTHKRRDGWLPVTYENGRESILWYTRALDRGEAMAIATRAAYELAERYIGDWNVTVRGRP